jgi:hypothetical protein
MEVRRGFSVAHTHLLGRRAALAFWEQRPGDCEDVVGRGRIEMLIEGEGNKRHFRDHTWDVGV